MDNNSLTKTTSNTSSAGDLFQRIYSYEESFSASLEYFNNNEFAAKIFVDKYALRDKEDRLVEKTPEETHRRLAREFARIEKNKFKKPLTEDEIFRYLDKFSKIIPQGSPMFAIGNPFQIVSSSNCFVVESPLDSYSSILKTDEELAQISKRRGGVGLDISNIRPNGSLTSNSSRTSTGIIPFMCRYSNTIREVGQCIHGDSLILTSSGLERIKNIKVGDSVWTKNGWKSVVSTHKTNKDSIKITTKKGRTIICSKDHPFHTLNGEKEAGSFLPGDNVTYIVGQEWYGEDVSLDSINYNRSSYNNSNKLEEFNYPKILDKDFAYLLGYSYGDGYIPNKKGKDIGISLSCDRKWKNILLKLIEIFKNILEKDEICFRERKNENCDEIRVVSMCLVEFLKYNGLLKQKTEDIIFPEKLLKAKKEILFSFISGYFDADGCVVKSKKTYKMSSINYNFLQTIQCIFSSFGICSTIHHDIRRNNCKDIYTLCINGRKSQELLKDLMSESIKVSNIVFSEKKRDYYQTLYNVKDFGTNSSRHSYIIDNDQRLSYSTVGKLTKDLSIKNNYFLLNDEIKEVVEHEKNIELYDIGLEDTHFFFANGLYVHNSGRRGAEMLTISIHHPESVIPWDNSIDGEPYDIEIHNPSLGSFKISSKYYNPKKIDFATSKYDPSKVTGANISIRLSDEFLKALENDDYFEQRWPVDSDNPVIRKKVKAKDVWDKIIYSAWRTAEPGLLFWDTMIRESPADCYSKYGFKSISTNPCLTYETKVSVADGRGFVEIGKLAEEGLDVPVFCCDDKGKIVVRTMRNPRITGYNEDVYKVILDDGSSFNATGNHKVMLNNGEYVEILKLQEGDSLHIGKKFESKIVDAFKNQYKTRNEKLYFILRNSFSNFLKTEHRYIYEYYFGSVPKNFVIHHKDHNSKNNTPQNLEAMNKKDHIKYHAINMIGDKNPIFKIKADAEKFSQYSRKMSEMCSGLKNGNSINISNEDIKKHALKLTKDLGRRFSMKDYIEYADKNNLPKNFTDFREKELGSVIELSKTCAKEFGFSEEEINLDPRLIKNYNRIKNQGYDCFIKDNTVFIKKECANCGCDFFVTDDHRERCVCGISCSNFYVNKNTDTNKRRTDTINATYKNKANKNKKQQLDIYTKLKYELNRKPKLKEFEQECFKNNISCRLKTKYGFKNFAEIEEQALSHNHRVVSVKYIGKETVYNGTVDEFHNFYMGGWESTFEDGKKEWIMVNSKNCGEIVLSPNDSCRLLAINLFNFVVNPFTNNSYFDYKNFYETSKIAQRLMDDLVDIELECVRRILNKIDSDPEPEEIKSRERGLWLKIYEACETGRRTGTGILALGDTLAAMNIKYGTEAGINETDKIYNTLKLGCYRSSVDMAKEIGSFKVWDKDLEKDNPFLNRFKSETVDLGNGEIIKGIDIWNEMQIYGRRNIALLTTAPTGSISNLAKLVNNFGTSSGIEPQYSITPYTRKKKGNPGDKNFRSDSVDQNGDHWMHFKIYSSAVQEWIDISGEEDITKSPWYKNTAEDLDWNLRVSLQAKANAHIDHSISSTVNIPNNTSVEKVAEIYETAWRSCCKGITVYRDGCRTGVLVRDTEESKKTKNDHRLNKTDAPKRPKSLECDVHHIKVQGEEYFVLVGIYHGEVYEIFAGKNGMISKDVKKGEIKKIKRGHYQAVLDNGEIIDNVCEFITDDQAAITRLASLSLRHGSDIKHCVTSLEKVPGDMTSLAKSMARALKKYIKDGEKQTGIECGSCGSESIIRQEGCITCRNCGWSKCS